jgi:catechol 2,3-dioxygenase-like lactoylglutathione lyase family enzyme
MIDHIVIPVTDLERAKAFYEPALASLGHRPILEFPGVAGYGSNGKPSFWIREAGSVTPAHVAFASPDRATVDAFHDAALAAGGRDNGAPGVRDVYHPSYYGAFVLDPDGHNVEAVCHLPE